MTTEVRAPLAPGDAPAGAGRFPCFDGLRALAALSVLAFHVSTNTGLHISSPGMSPYLLTLDIGVAVFFLISGFLLYRPFARAHLGGGRSPAPTPYLARRFLRIYPAYWLALAVTVYVLREGSPVANARDFFHYFGLLHTYYRRTALGPLLQSWTLVIEVAFYLFLPLYAAATRWAGAKIGTRHRVKVEVTGLAVLFVTAQVWTSFLLHNGDPSDDYRTNWLPGWLDLFALGMLLAVAYEWRHMRADPGRSRLDHRAMPWFAWSIAVALFALTSIATEVEPGAAVGPGVQTARHLLYGACALFVLIPAVFGPQDTGAIRRALASRPLATAGLVSYGIYLWHLTIINEYLDRRDLRVWHAPFWSTLFVTLVVTIAISTASYLLLERPLMRVGHRVGRRVHRGRTEGATEGRPT